MSTDKSIRHIPSLTPLRGIAALWVLLFHLDVIVFYRELGPLLPHDTTGILQKGYLWVDFFFILSGFIIAHVYGKTLKETPLKHALPRYLWARFSRLYPLHLATLLIAVAGATIAASIAPALIDGSWKTYFDWRAIPSNLMFTHAMKQHTYLSWNIVSWSIGAEWWTYVTAIPLVILLRDRLPAAGVAVMLGAFALLAWLAVSLGNNKLDITFDYGFLRCLLEFSIGLGLHILYRHSWLKRYLGGDAAFAMISAAIIVVFHFSLNDLFIVPLFALLILASSYNRTRLNKTLARPSFQYLGNISYSLYLVHSLWFLVYWFLLPQLELTMDSGSLPVSTRMIFVGSFIALTLICSHFTYHHIEIRCRKKMRKWFS